MNSEQDNAEKGSAAPECISPPFADIEDEDIFGAMKEISGFIDVTPGDFKEIFLLAYRRAVERLTASVKVGQVMTRRVVSVSRDTSLQETASIMALHKISGLPVLDPGGQVAGVISEKDFLSTMGPEGTTSFMAVVAECLKGRGCLAVPVRRSKAEDLMTSPAVTVSEDLSVLEVARLFIEKSINRVPVTDREGRLTGIVSRADIVRSRLPGLF